MFALFGAAGQALYNSADSRNSEQAAAPEKDLKNSWLNSKWSPMKVLSDEEYENMLREKLLRVNAEIALVDESIEALRIQEQEMEAKKQASSLEGAGLTKK
jgi:predicted house-cleaning noncanonical NTP pyrophosphatase (MazG superfamily)